MALHRWKAYSVQKTKESILRAFLWAERKCAFALIASGGKSAGGNLAEATRGFWGLKQVLEDHKADEGCCRGIPTFFITLLNSHRVA